MGQVGARLLSGAFASWLDLLTATMNGLDVLAAEAEGERRVQELWDRGRAQARLDIVLLERLLRAARARDRSRSPSPPPRSRSPHRRSRSRSPSAPPHSLTGSNSLSVPMTLLGSRALVFTHPTGTPAVVLTNAPVSASTGSLAPRPVHGSAGVALRRHALRRSRPVHSWADVS